MWRGYQIFPLLKKKKKKKKKKNCILLKFIIIWFMQAADKQIDAAFSSFLSFQWCTLSIIWTLFMVGGKK